MIVVYEVKLSGSYYDMGLRTGKMLEKDKWLNISDYLVNRKIDLVITTVEVTTPKENATTASAERQSTSTFPRY